MLVVRTAETEKILVEIVVVKQVLLLDMVIVALATKVLNSGKTIMVINALEKEDLIWDFGV